MREYDVNNLNEQEFDSMLQSSMAELPPDDIAYEVTPWRKAINRILTGFALGAITLNFFGLNYLLPAIGMILTILGFRTLRKENKWFNACWIITVVRSAYYFPTLILNTTIYQSTFYASSIASVLNVLNMAIIFLLYICFWKALRSVQEKAGIEPHAGGVAALIVWSAFICALAILQVPGGLLLGIVFLIFYICIIRSLVKLSKELDEAGYCISTAPVRFTDKTISIVLVIAILIGCGCGYLFFHQHPMDWQAASQTENTEIQQVKDHLQSLGFPEHILDDLTEEDLLSCKDAVRVVVEVNDHPVNNGRRVQELQEDGVIHIYTAYDQEELRITGIGVELAGEREQWKIFHHFQWVINPGFYGTDVIQLWPAYRNNKGWVSCSDLSGQVLYNEGSQVYTAPYYCLGNETYTSTSIFWGEQTSTDVFAEFSMPRDGENHRGYVSYTIEEVQEGWLIDAWINYTHQVSWLQYPAITAKEKHLTLGVSDTNAFNTIQDALQFSAIYDDSEVQDGNE